MFGIVYVTVNKIDGNKYIGQHKCKNENDSYLGSGKALLNAIKKYGAENFERHTLYKAETENELDEMEIKFISLFNATHRKDYYNINEGGSANRMCGENNPMYGRRGKSSPGYGRKKSEEEKQKLRERMSGENNPMYEHVYTKEELNKIGAGLRGEKHWHYGQHWSDDVKQKISKANKGKKGWNKGKKMPEETKQKLSASKKGKKQNLSDDVRKKRAEVLVERNHTEKFKQQISSFNKRFHESGGRRGNKPVVCVETNIIYASAYDAARAINCGLSSISACLCGSCKTVKGFHWRKATPEEINGELVYVP